jgi:UDP-N-acetylmuramate dehydrogenase
MITIQEHISLLAYNTFGFDYQARYFCMINTVAELIELLQHPLAKEKSLFILGGGSNLLLTSDLDTLVVKINITGIHIEEENNQEAILKAGAGEMWHDFVIRSLDYELYGLENLSLIPGCVGAAPMQNIGAYGTEIKDTFEYLEAIHIETQKIRLFNNSDCLFGYRESIFKRDLKNQYIITHVAFRLSKNFEPNTHYGAISQELEKMGVAFPSARDVSNAVIAIRSSKLPNPKEIGNSGSFFKNPVISTTQFTQLLSTYPDMASYPVDEFTVKIAAGWLIERAGWKGKTFDNRYGVHKNQALVLVNYGGAKGSEVFELSEAIILDIKDKFGITLEREVNLL